MNRVELGDVVRYDDRLAEVISVGEGRTVTLAFIGSEPCHACGHEPHVSLLEHSPLFQQGVKPVATVRDSIDPREAAHQRARERAGEGI